MNATSKHITDTIGIMQLCVPTQSCIRNRDLLKLCQLFCCNQTRSSAYTTFWTFEPKLLNTPFSGIKYNSRVSKNRTASIKLDNGKLHLVWLAKRDLFKTFTINGKVHPQHSIGMIKILQIYFNPVNNFFLQVLSMTLLIICIMCNFQYEVLHCICNTTITDPNFKNTYKVKW